MRQAGARAVVAFAIATFVGGCTKRDERLCNLPETPCTAPQVCVQPDPDKVGVCTDPDLLDAGAIADASPGIDVSVPVDSSVGADAALPSSCKEILARNPASPTGFQTIHPGGATVNIFCDQSHDGGGWSEVFRWSAELSSTTVPYDRSEAALLSSATQALISYRDAGGTIVANWAVIPMPPEWKTASPFTYPGNSFAIAAGNWSLGMSSATTATQQPLSTMLQYGYSGYAGGTDGCNTAWVLGSNEGRICLSGAAAPCFIEWAHATRQDACSQATPEACSGADLCVNNTRRFSIAVR